MKCAMCGTRTNSEVEVPFMKIYKEHHEWTVFPKTGIVCKGCLKWVRHESFREFQLWNEPMPSITGPGPWEDSAIGTVIAVFDSKIIGLRCAKIKYGVDAVSEIARGYKYLSERGDTVVRITVNDVPETDRCGKCGLSLWACNSLEVMI